MGRRLSDEPASDVFFSALCFIVQTYSDSGVSSDDVKAIVQEIYEERSKNKPEVH